jgi:hypothetical protein
MSDRIARCLLFAVPWAILAASPSILLPYGSERSFVLSAVVLVMMALIVKGQQTLSPVSAAFLCFAIATLVSDALSADPARSLFGATPRHEGFGMIATVIFYFWGTEALLNTEVLWEKFLRVWTLSVTAAAVYGLVQASAHLMNGDLIRITGPMGNSDFYAIFLLLGIFISLLVRRGDPQWAKFALWAIPLQATALCLSGSRAALGRALLALLAGRSLLTLSLVAIIAVLLSADPFHSGLINDERFAFWPTEWAQIQNHPWFGMGQEGGTMLFNGSMLDRAHNLVLDLLRASGVFGLASYAAVLLVSVRNALRITDDRRYIILGALVAYTSASMFLFDNILSLIPLVTILAWTECHAVVADRVGSNAVTA